MHDKDIGSRGVVRVNGAAESDCPLCYSKGYTKLSTFDWVDDIPRIDGVYDIIEVQFKNTRKGLYRNVNGNNLAKGDIVAVEASPGHDIGVVSLTGWMVRRQMVRQGVDATKGEFKKIYRKAKSADIEKWMEATALEHTTMIKSRQIAERLNLNMKIGDVEYQGDRTKAIFYYIADDRVDFRELIKILGEEFHIRVEMRQIGARQEAGRIGGIGSCGRELCCSAWMSNFISVSTNAAKIQEISLNPQKLAGQCGKLKCCLNYEVNSYIDARKDFPDTNVPLETQNATYYHSKTDIFMRTMWYSTAPNFPANLVEVPVDRVKEIIAVNRKGRKVEMLLSDKFAPKTEAAPIGFGSDLEGNIERFDGKKKKKRTKSRAGRDRATPSDNSRKAQPAGERTQPDGAVKVVKPNRNLPPVNPKKTDTPQR